MENIISFEIPSKTFILGEYLALKGTSSLILSSQPSFSISVKEGENSFSAKSPAGVYLQKKKMLDFGFSIKDPHHGKGGFGCSTAEFLAAYVFSKIKENESEFHSVVEKIKLDLEGLILDYRESAGREYRPSGADLVAQLMGGLCLYDGMNFKAETKDWPFPGYNLMVFHTGKKVKTHDHLKNLKKDDFQGLMPLLLRGLIALQGAQLKPFCESLNKYYDKLNSFGLSDQEIHQKVLTLRDKPYVLAAKGCGAMGVDTIALIAQRSDKEEILEITKDLDLEYVTSSDQVHGGIKEI